MAMCLVLGASACLPEEEVYDVECAGFNSSLNNYFPPSVGDTLVFSDTSGVNFRRFPVERRFVFADTIYSSLSPNETCVPFVEYYLSEVDASRTALFYFINDLSATSGAGAFSIGINFADASVAGIPYFQQFVVRPSLRGQLSTNVRALDSLVVNDFTYQSVIRAELIGLVPSAGSYYNNVRTIWIAPGGGIIQFEDDRLGLWMLRRP